MDNSAGRGVIVALIAVALGAMVAPTIVSAQEPAGEEERLETVTVSAFKEVDIAPDEGTVSLGVAVHSQSAEAAKDKLTNRARRIISAIRNIGFSDDEISTSDVELERTCLDKCRDPNPDDNKIPEPVIGYRGSAAVRVETGQLKRLGEVIDVGVNAGATRIRGVSFDVSDDSEAVKLALRQAMQFATDKATILAETGGAQLGPAIQILEGRSRAPQEYAVPRPVLAATVAGGTSGGGGQSENPFPIEPPMLSADARVEVTYELR